MAGSKDPVYTPLNIACSETEDANGNEALDGYIDIDAGEPNETSCCSKQISNCTDPKRWLERLPILTWLPKYNFQDLYGDAVAGVTVALTVIPQGLALAGVAQLPPEYGLYTAFMGSFVYIFVGSAKDLTIGPTAIMCIMTSQYSKFGGPTYAVLLSLLSGIVQLFLGLLNLGFIIDFISGSVISAFTSASALTIASTQLKGLTGIPINSEHFFEVIRQLFANSSQIRWNDTILGVSCMVVLLALRFFRASRINENTTRLPKFLSKSINTIWFTIVTTRNVIVVLICGGLAAVMDAQGRRPFALTDAVKGGLPPIRVPDFTYTFNDTRTNTTTTLTFPEILADLNMGVIVIALLSILESVAIAKAFAKGKRLNATQEMVALGCCNIAGSFVSAFPATGSFSRSAINNSSGVRTPMGGLFTGGVVLSALAFFSPYFKFIPKATLAAIIITSVIFMIHYEDVAIIWRTSRVDMAPYLFTFFGSFLFGLEYGIMMGVIMAVVLLLHHSARPNVTVSTVKTGNSSYVLCRIDRTVLFPSALYVTGKIGRKICDEVNRRGQETTLVMVDGSRLSRVDYTTCMVSAQKFSSLPFRYKFSSRLLDACRVNPIPYSNDPESRLNPPACCSLSLSGTAGAIQNRTNSVSSGGSGCADGSAIELKCSFHFGKLVDSEEKLIPSSGRWQSACSGYGAREAETSCSPAAPY